MAFAFFAFVAAILVFFHFDVEDAAPIVGSPPRELSISNQDVGDSRAVTPSQPSSTPALANATHASGAVKKEGGSLVARIQNAVASQQLGLAYPAAKEINNCISVELGIDNIRSAAQDPKYGATAAQVGSLVEAMERQVRECQALDVGLRGQLDELLRRAVREGERGAAVDLVNRQKDATEANLDPSVKAGLLKDARSCHVSSLRTLHALAGIQDGWVSDAEFIAQELTLKALQDRRPTRRGDRSLAAALAVGAGRSSRLSPNDPRVLASLNEMSSQCELHK